MLSRPLHTCLARALALCAGCITLWVMLPAAHAQDGLSTARFGQRYLTVGWVTQPGVITDDNEPPTERHSEAAFATAGMVKVGLHHMIHPKIAMSAEVDLGVQWVDDHTAAPDGAAREETAFGWQLGIMGRWIPSGDLSGVSAGAGLHLFNARLEEAPFQSMAFEGRLGWVFWRGEREPRFAMIELGWSLPIVSGLRLPNQFTTGNEEVNVEANQNWSWQRGMIGIQGSF